MTNYFYKAVNQSGQVVKRHIDAVNETDLELRISAMDLELIGFKACKSTQLRTKNQIRPKELITVTLHIQQLLNAGVPILDALRDLRDSAGCLRVKDVISGIIEGISSGQTFSQALAQFPGTFSSVYVNTVHVGETSGRLVTVMHALVKMLKWEQELAKKVKAVSIYPIFVLLVVCSVAAFLMLYLVPQLIPFLKMSAEEISWHTQLLINLSFFAQRHWLLIIGLPILICIATKFAVFCSVNFNEKIDHLRLRIPIFGPISHKIKMARFCNMFALMYSSGITVLDSIKLGITVVNNSALECALRTVFNEVSDGKSISQSFAGTNLFPAIVVRMISVGENTGDMTESLSNAYYFLSNDVKNVIDILEPAVMPVITIFLGGFVGWIMLSIMGPIYDAVVNLSAL